MSDISFLPASLREQEEEIKQDSLKTSSTGVVSMHVPEAEEEDVEIIEVDASEVDEMLIGEPLYTRLYYKASLLVDSLKEKYLAPRPLEPPAKTPPQFFKPSAKGEAETITATAKPAEKSTGKHATTPIATSKTSVGTAQAKPGEPAKPGQKSSARIRPSLSKPRVGRRVRIIKRVRKPVHVSLLDEQVMKDLHINIPKRQFTLVFLAVLFSVIFAGAYLLLDQAIAQAITKQNEIQSNFNSLSQEIKTEQGKWKSFQDLEPRLITLSDLLDSHVSASSVLKFLEENTLVDVSYDSFMMTEDGRVNLGVTALNFNTAARQLLIFEESPYVESAESNAFSLAGVEGGQYITFQLVIDLKPEALRFYKSNNQKQQ
ncbi:MAG: hypothetical protein P1P90_00775 [Patescibacteria group bacterium]|nr:hypothetical protein [Patescibacteria group bacterium]